MTLDSPRVWWIVKLYEARSRAIRANHLCGFFFDMTCVTNQLSVQVEMFEAFEVRVKAIGDCPVCSDSFQVCGMLVLVCFGDFLAGILHNSSFLVMSS